jgi:hypothetical protein
MRTKQMWRGTERKMAMKRERKKDGNEEGKKERLDHYNSSEIQKLF